jgi:calcineurin-like phosphoesterase
MGNVHAPALRLPVRRRRARARGETDDVKMVLVDLHAEVTSEKWPGWYSTGA